MMVDLIKFVFLVFKSVFEAHFQCAKHPLSFSLELDSLSAPAPPKTESHGRVKPEVGNIALVALASSDDCCAGWISWMAQGMGAWHATVRALACPHVRGAADDVITTHCVRVLFDLGHRPTVCAGYWQTPFSVSRPHLALFIGRIPEFCRPLPVQYRTTRTPSSLINMIVVYSLFFLVFKAL
jgi:hypothetical protein